MKKFFIIAFLLNSISLFPQRQMEQMPSLIAHGGGELDSVNTTNAWEAIIYSIDKYKYIEIDLLLTSDSFLVAAHDWSYFNELTNRFELGDSVLSLREFENQRILGKYKPTTYLDIQGLLRDNTDWILVTDKFDDAVLLDRYFGEFKDRMLVEAFSIEAFNELKAAGFIPMYSDGPLDKILLYSIENMMKDGEPIDFITDFYSIDFDSMRRTKCLMPFRVSVYTSDSDSYVNEHLGDDVDLIYTNTLKP